MVLLFLFFFLLFIINPIQCCCVILTCWRAVLQVFSKSRLSSKENINNSEERLVLKKKLWNIKFSTLPHLSNFHTVPKIVREVRNEEKVGDRETQRERKCREERERERWRLRQTVWLHRDLQHSASYDSGVRGYPHWWISGRASSPSQKKGSCFHSLGLESLFQESILPARDCKPVSRQKSYVHKYYFFFSFFTVLSACQNI